MDAVTGSAGCVVEGVLDLPQDHGAYQEPYLTAEEERTALGVEVAPARHFVDWREVVRDDGTENADFLRTEENCRAKN